MSRVKITMLLVALLILYLLATACAGMTSQGPLEQKRPAEIQQPASVELTEKTSNAKLAQFEEKTAREEAEEKTAT
jgi:hypothetical protein